MHKSLIFSQLPPTPCVLSGVSLMPPRGGTLIYMGYIGTCRRIGYGFGGSRSLNRVLGGTPYNGLHGEAPPERGTFFRLQVRYIEG